MPKGAAVRLTKKLIDDANPGVKERYLWDTNPSGFGVRISTKGAKSFVFQYRSGKGRSARQRRAKIGSYGSLTLEQARTIARKMAGKVAGGVDPVGESCNAKSNNTTMSELFDRYMSDHAIPNKKPSSVEHDRVLLKLHLLPAFDKTKVADLTRSDVDRFHKAMSGKRTTANRCLSLLSKALNLAEVWGLRPDGSNPCRHVERFKEKAKERFLTGAEFGALEMSLRKAEAGEIFFHRTPRSRTRISLYAVAAIRLLLLTGARKTEILSLRWEYVHFEGPTPHIALPDSKSGKKRIILPDLAVSLLKKLPRCADNPFVIVGGKTGSHLVNLKDPWKAIRQAAGLKDVRIHDLRHSFASLAASNGMSLQLLGALLGHRDVKTTQRYAHLWDEPLRAASNSVAVLIERSENFRNERT